MKTYLSMVLALLCLSGSAAMAQSVLKFEPSHTSVIVSYQHFGLSRPTMKIMGATGSLSLDMDHPELASVEVSLDMASLSTGLAEFDTTLKGEAYFDSARFPKASFKSTRVEILSPDTANVYGDLTIHGVTKPVMISVKFNKRGFNPALFKTGVGFSGKLMIKRSDFGVGKFTPIIADEVELNIEAEAY